MTKVPVSGMFLTYEGSALEMERDGEGGTIRSSPATVESAMNGEPLVQVVGT